MCGECGAKIRYQKWNKNGDCKLVCYSTQKSKPSLVKSDSCESERYWASDIEQAVIAELFRMTYLGDDDARLSESYIDPTEALAKELKEAKRKLSRLYDLDDGDDEILLEKIQMLRNRIRHLQFQITSEDEKKRIARRVAKAKSILRTLESSWPQMSDKERQSVCQDLIDRVVIYKNGIVDVYLKLRSYLIHQ